jgi:hypothetical protein
MLLLLLLPPLTVMFVSLRAALSCNMCSQLSGAVLLKCRHLAK